MKFSERIGKKQIKSEIQLDSMDNDLRNGLWNVINMFILEPMQEKHDLTFSPFKQPIEAIWYSFFKEPIDDMPYGTKRVTDFLRTKFFSWDYVEVYDFVDFIASMSTLPLNKSEFINMCNFILKRELSGYRFVNDQLVPITSQVEIAEIENAMTSSSRKTLKGVNIHLQEALAKLANKKSPDYRNSIKESISAVEALCQLITGEPKTELSKTLKILKNKVHIHAALEQAFIKMYGYTSDSDGIRHAMLDETNLDQEDALYMLVTCSAFVNYLISKANKSNLLLN